MQCTEVQKKRDLQCTEVHKGQDTSKARYTYSYRKARKSDIEEFYGSTYPYMQKVLCTEVQKKRDLQCTEGQKKRKMNAFKVIILFSKFSKSLC